MKKPKITVFHNTIRDTKVYIVVFINKPFSVTKAREVLKTYSSLKYIGRQAGWNAITFIERKENFDGPLLTTEEWAIGEIMLRTLPDEYGNLSDDGFKDIMKICGIEKAVMFEVKGVENET